MKISGGSLTCNPKIYAKRGSAAGPPLGHEACMRVQRDAARVATGVGSSNHMDLSFDQGLPILKNDSDCTPHFLQAVKHICTIVSQSAGGNLFLARE